MSELLILSYILYLSLEASTLGNGEDSGSNNGNSGNDGDGSSDDDYAVV